MNINKPIKDFYYDEEKKVYVDVNIISKFMIKIFSWMFFGLMLTTITIYMISSSYLAIKFLFENQSLFLLFLMLELGISIYLSNSNINKMSLEKSKILFVIYSLLNGITLSPLNIYYSNIIVLAAMTASILFGIMALYGYLSKENFSKYNYILNISLIILLIASFINMFLKISFFELLTGYFGIITFMFLIAYKVNRLKRISIDLAQYESPENIDKYSIRGALSLYIDMINLFMYIIKIFSNQKKKNKN